MTEWTVFDRHDRDYSIKGEERAKRGVSSGFEVKITGGNTPVPKQWAKYVSNPANKSNLTVFLCERLCKASEKMPENKVAFVGGGFRDGMDVVSISKN